MTPSEILSTIQPQMHDMQLMGHSVLRIIEALIDDGLAEQTVRDVVLVLLRHGWKQCRR